jgi:hypothetical protein
MGSSRAARGPTGGIVFRLSQCELYHGVQRITDRRLHTMTTQWRFRVSGASLIWWKWHRCHTSTCAPFPLNGNLPTKFPLHTHNYNRHDRQLCSHDSTVLAQLSVARTQLRHERQICPHVVGPCSPRKRRTPGTAGCFQPRELRANTAKLKRGYCKHVSRAAGNELWPTPTKDESRSTILFAAREADKHINARPRADAYHGMD